MYNDNERSSYEYHYSYRPESGGFQPQIPMEPQPKRSRGKKIVAGVLCAALLMGGSFGAGWFLKGWGGPRQETQVMQSERQTAKLETVSVTGSKKLTFPEVYAANVNSCVSINVSSTGYNIFYQPVNTASSGSGFIITADGYIVTNYHVVSGGTDVEVTLNNGTTYTAQVVGGDADYDIAVLKVDPGRSEERRVGTECM